MEWITVYSNGHIFILNQIENKLKGKIMETMMVLFLDSSCVLMAYMLEDILYPTEKINAVGGVWHNWPWYVNYFLNIPAYFIL
jgi:hypothetical protein